MATAIERALRDVSARRLRTHKLAKTELLHLADQRASRRLVAPRRAGPDKNFFFLFHFFFSFASHSGECAGDCEQRLAGDVCALHGAVQGTARAVPAATGLIALAPSSRTTTDTLASKFSFASSKRVPFFFFFSPC